MSQTALPGQRTTPVAHRNRTLHAPHHVPYCRRSRRSRGWSHPSFEATVGGFSTFGTGGADTDPTTGPPNSATINDRNNHEADTPRPLA